MVKIFYAGNGFYKKEYEALFLNCVNNRLYSYYFLTDNLGKHLWDGMKLYFADAESWYKVLSDFKADNMLFSYFYIDHDKKEAKLNLQALSQQKSFFLDSGGYSAFTKGVKIDIDKYCDFIIRNKEALTVYACLDVIGDAKGTAKNQAYMESRGLNPLPVFHYGEDYGILREMAQHYKYIALGGLVPLARNKPVLMKHLDKCFSITQHKNKTHGFGMTGIEILKRYPFYTVDSTSWLGGTMRAEIYKFDLSKGTLKTIKTKDERKANYQTIAYTDDNDKRWLPRLINNVAEWQKFEIYLNDIWNKRGIVWKD